MKISYLGPIGTFSEEAARSYDNGQGAYLDAPTIEQAVEMVESRHADRAIVPVENSTEGSVGRSLDVLLKTETWACGEVYLPIHHQLLGKGDDLPRVEEVIAHPQALGQCRVWLKTHLPHARLTPVVSNGEAARLAADDPRKAAVAGIRAATIYALHIIRENIEDAADNTTRFLVLGAKDCSKPTGKDKTTFICSVPHRTGSLHQLLDILARRDINMTRIESRPAAHAMWEYNFFIDIDGHRTDAAVRAALTEIADTALFLKVVGSYPGADTCPQPRKKA